jgi:hypothetical protein
MSGKVFLMVTVSVAEPTEFNTFWERESLPHWLRYGRHVGSWVSHPEGNGPADRIVRLFEYESLDKWREWTAWLNGTPEGKDLLSQLHRFNIVVQPCLLAPAPNSDRIEL